MVFITECWLLNNNREDVNKYSVYFALNKNSAKLNNLIIDNWRLSVCYSMAHIPLQQTAGFFTKLAISLPHQGEQRAGKQAFAE